MTASVTTATRPRMHSTGAETPGGRRVIAAPRDGPSQATDPAVKPQLTTRNRVSERDTMGLAGAGKLGWRSRGHSTRSTVSSRVSVYRHCRRVMLATSKRCPINSSRRHSDRHAEQIVVSVPDQCSCSSRASVSRDGSCRQRVNTDPGVACRQGVKIRAPLTAVSISSRPSRRESPRSPLRMRPGQRSEPPAPVYW